MMNRRTSFRLLPTIKYATTAFVGALIIMTMSCGDEGIDDPIDVPLELTSQVNNDKSGKVSFKASAEGATSYQLLPGDSSPELKSTNGEFVYNYAKSGKYTVMATAIFPSGDPVSKEIEVDVEVKVDIELIELEITEVTNDKSGKVTFKATAKGATNYKLLPGDDSPELESADGEFNHAYTESGKYTAKATAIFASGDPVSKEIEIDVDIVTLGVAVEIANDNSGQVAFTATAAGATNYKLLPGDDSPELESANGEFSHTYAQSGKYTAKATAIFASGDPISKEIEINVTVDEEVAVLGLPITHESSAITYGWDSFGGPEGGKLIVEIVDNPDKTVGANADLTNTSSKVMKMVKVAESEVWAGTFIILDEPIDFATNGMKIKLKIWAPTKDAVVLLKVEAKNDKGEVSHAINAYASTFVANAWQTLTFDFIDGAAPKSGESYTGVVISYDTNFSPQSDLTSYYDDLEFGEN